MIRPVLAILIATSIMVFVWQYASFVERTRPEPVNIVEFAAEGQYDVHIVCTFDCEGNAFGFPAAKVLFRGRDLLELEPGERIVAGQKIAIRDVPDIKQGLNDFHVQVTPAETDSTPGGAFSLRRPTEPAGKTSVARAVRVVVLHNGYEIASEMIWSAAAGPFGELVSIDVPRASHRH